MSGLSGAAAIKRPRTEAAAAVQRLVEKQVLEQGQRILCYGCGNGADVSWLRLRKFDAFGFDTHEPFGYSQMPPGKFDCVLLVYLMKRLQTDEVRRQQIARAFDIVRPGGYFVIASRNWMRFADKSGFNAEDACMAYLRHLLEACECIEMRALHLDTGDQSICLLARRAGIYQPRNVFRLVETPEDLEAACAYLSGCRAVGLDVETTLAEPRKLCTVQLATDERTYIIDALALSNLSPLKRLMESPALTKIIHNAMFEEQMLATRGIKIVNVFDTLPASRKKYKRPDGGHKLGEVCERELGIYLDKSLQTSDWTARPLSPQQLSYAAIDAEVLMPLHTVFCPPPPPENLVLFGP